jgi:hypothetical protein
MSPLVAVQPGEAAGHSRSRACPLIARRLNLGRRHQRLRRPTVRKGGAALIASVRRICQICIDGGPGGPYPRRNRKSCRHDKSCVSRCRPVDQSTPSAVVLALTGCSGLSAPTAQSIAGLSPSGNVTITADFVAGLGGGRTLYYQGRHIHSNCREVFSALAGGEDRRLGRGLQARQRSRVSGQYTQSTGAAGSSTSGGSDLWLQNSAGVIMHLQGTSTGAMLPLGRDEIFIRMVQ